MSNKKGNNKAGKDAIPVREGTEDIGPNQINPDINPPEKKKN
jgi:hypothetical protein